MRYVFVLLLLATPIAEANLVTFDLLNGGWDVAGNGSMEFQQDTGLPGIGYVGSDVAKALTGRFTIETTNPGILSDPDFGQWIFDEPGTGLSITFGPVTIVAPLELQISTREGVKFIQLSSALENKNIQIRLNIVDSPTTEPGLSEPTLLALISESLDGYGGLGVVRNGWSPNIAFGVIQRVPEPGTLSLVVGGLLAFALTRRTRLNPR